MNGHSGHESPVDAEVLPRIERISAIDALHDEWDTLAERAGSIFATWEWSRVWWRHFGQGRELLLYACRESSGRLSSVLPLYAWRARRPRVVRFLGHGPGDELGPVHAQGDEDVAARHLREVLGGLDFNVFLGEQLPGDERWSGLLGGRVWRREASPVLHIPQGGWDDYLEGRSSNFREQLRRRRRELERLGHCTFRLADEHSLDRDLDTLFRLHRARWGSRPTDFSDSSFHRDLARAALERGWLRLWLLEVRGRPVATWHGFQVGPIASYYQAGRDPTYEKYSVGFMLLAHTVREAITEGATEYRFGRGDESFKRRFTDDGGGLVTVALVRGRGSELAYSVARAARCARQQTRRLRRL